MVKHQESCMCFLNLTQAGDLILSSLGCNTGMGNSAVSQPRVPQVRVRFWNSGPEAVPQPVTAVSRVFAVLSVHCQPKSRSVISSYTYFHRTLFWNIRSVDNSIYNTRDRQKVPTRQIISFSMLCAPYIFHLSLSF